MAYTTIKKPSDYFNTVTYTGDGVDGRVIDTGHDTNFVWIKERSGTDPHSLFDIVRGAGQRLRTNTNAAEGSIGSKPDFVTGGFNLPTTISLNGSGATFVSWSWSAGGTASSNTDGSITSTVSANTTSGFSIVTRTGTGSVGTVGHGLGSVPKMIITKKRSAVDNWGVYHASLGATKYLVLNSTDASGTSTSPFNNTEPTSSLFTVGTGTTWNASGATFVDYCFAEKQGFSKFGSYTGNGSTDGTFIYTGFKPAMIIVKRTDLGANWNIWDNGRDPVNGLEGIIYPNTSDAEGRGIVYLDFLSNGFKWKDGNSKWNASGGNYIYMAFAAEPLVGDNPATAR